MGGGGGVRSPIKGLPSIDPKCQGLSVLSSACRRLEQLGILPIEVLNTSVV